MPSSFPNGIQESASHSGARLGSALAIAGLILLAHSSRPACAQIGAIAPVDTTASDTAASDRVASPPAPEGLAIDTAARDSASGAPPSAMSAPQDIPAADTAAVVSPTSDSADLSAPQAIGTSGSGALEIPIPSDEEDGFVVEVDPGQSLNKNKSLPLAMLFSAAMPGAGEYYLQEKGHAKVFLLAEAGFWAALYMSFVSRDSYLQSARNYASEYAGIDASGKSAGFLETMANYRSYQEKHHRQDSYELAQILSGKRKRDYDIAPTEENDWDFGSSANPGNTDNWRTFQSTLRYYRASKVAISFAVGALALNRVVSLANTLNLYKRTSVGGMGLRIIPEIGPDYTGTRVSLNF